MTPASPGTAPRRHHDARRRSVQLHVVVMTSGVARYNSTSSSAAAVGDRCEIFPLTPEVVVLALSSPHDDKTSSHEEFARPVSDDIAPRQLQIDTPTTVLAVVFSVQICILLLRPQLSAVRQVVGGGRSQLAGDTAGLAGWPVCDAEW